MQRAVVSLIFVVTLLGSSALMAQAPVTSDWTSLQGRWAPSEAACGGESDSIVTITRSGVSEYETSCRTTDRRRTSNGWQLRQICQVDENTRPHRVRITITGRSSIRLTTREQDGQEYNRALLRCTTDAAVLGERSTRPADQSPIPNIRYGTPYADVRGALISEGWSPSKETDADTCDASRDARCHPEMQACAGTGEGNCRYTWRKDGRLLTVFTVDDPPLFSTAQIAQSSAPQPAQAPRLSNQPTNADLRLVFLAGSRVLMLPPLSELTRRLERDNFTCSKPDDFAELMTLDCRSAERAREPGRSFSYHLSRVGSALMISGVSLPLSENVSQRLSEHDAREHVARLLRTVQRRP